MFRAKAGHRKPVVVPLAGEARRGPVIQLGSVRASHALAVLLYRSAAADQRAFADLYDATAPRVYGLATRILGSPAEAEEVALESYLEAWQTSACFDESDCSATAWVLAIVLRRVVERIDSAPVLTERLTVDVLPGNGRRVQPISEEAAPILEALTRLRPGQLALLDRSCRDRDREHPAPTSLLSTLVDATVWEGLPRMDGTTYQSPAAPAPGPEGIQ